jgi:predicted nucleotidyltransferase
MLKHLYFGSAVTENFNDESSDIDLLIEIDNEDQSSVGKT